MSKRHYKIGVKSMVEKGVKLGYVCGRLKKTPLLVIGAEAKIRAGTILYAGTVIGNRLETGHNVVIRESNTIGDDFCIWSNSVVDYGCKIGNNVKVHCNCYIAQFTVIEDDVFMAPGVTIANDLHPGCRYSKKCMKGPVIKKGAKIGVNVSIVPFVTIGENSLVGSGSVVTKDIPPGSVVYGNPARVRKDISQLSCTQGFTDKPY